MRARDEVRANIPLIDGAGIEAKPRRIWDFVTRWDRARRRRERTERNRNGEPGRQTENLGTLLQNRPPRTCLDCSRKTGKEKWRDPCGGESVGGHVRSFARTQRQIKRFPLSFTSTTAPDCSRCHPNFIAACRQPRVPQGDLLLFQIQTNDLVVVTDEDLSIGKRRHAPDNVAAECHVRGFDHFARSISSYFSGESLAIISSPFSLNSQ